MDQAGIEPAIGLFFAANGIEPLHLCLALREPSLQVSVSPNNTADPFALALSPGRYRQAFSRDSQGRPPQQGSFCQSPSLSSSTS